MAPTPVWVVGECFGRFTEHDAVITIGELRHRFETGDEPLTQELMLYPSLGIDGTAWRGLQEVIDRNDLAAKVLLGDVPPEPAPRHTVLKQSQDNVLIGAPRVAGEFSEAGLIVPNDSEMIRDHTADQQHVPGMLIIEAAIQLVTWTVGEMVPSAPGRPPRYAVMHDCRFSFHRFVFPLPTVLRVRLQQAGEATDQRVPLTAEATVDQSDKTTTRCHFELDAFDPEDVFTVEAGQARKAVAAHTRERAEVVSA